MFARRAFARLVAAPFLAAGVLVAPTFATASSSGNWGITRIALLDNEIAFVALEGKDASQIPGCATASDGGKEWTFPANTTKGKAILNMVLTAQAMHAQIYVVGTGACEYGWGREAIQQVHVWTP